MNSINLEEFKDIFEYLLDNNKKLAESGKKTTAIGVQSQPGYGKTSTIEQIARDRSMTFIKLNIAQIEEVGDILGLPIKQFKVIRHTETGDKEEWVSSNVLQTYFTLPCESYTVTEHSRMSYAPPEWLPKETNENGTLLLLDDFTRGSNFIIQSLYELIDRGEYISWKLPKNTTIAISMNPDDGFNNVTSIDDALVSRFVNFNIDFDVKIWSKWAETDRLDSRGINFALTYPEIFEIKDHRQVANARSFTTFINAISGISDWETSTSLALILNIAKGCFSNDKDNLVGHLFTTFIANKLDKLVSPEDMLLGKWETTKQHVKDCVYDDNGHYRPDVAAVLHTRLLNYCLYYFKQPKASTQVVQDRLLEFIEASEDKDTMLFSEDFIFDIIRVLMKYHPDRTNKFMLNKKIRERVK